MKVQRVVWTEGMLMSPQHLQQQDLYHEQQLARRIGWLTPYGWGVASLGIDPGALGTGRLHVQRFKGVLPDGLLVEFDQGDPEVPAARDIAQHFPATQKEPLAVYLGVLKEREGAPSFVEAGPGDGAQPPRTRFSNVGRNVMDLTGTAAPITVAFGNPNLRVLFANEPRDDYSTIKIAEVTRDGTGTFTLVETYIPPLLRVDGSTFIVDSLRRIQGFISGKQRELTLLRRQRDESTVEFSSSDVTRFLQLSTLNGIIPLLNHLAEHGEMSPHELYLWLVHVAGQLTTFSSDLDPNDLPTFEHLDLRGTFEALFAALTALIRSTVRKDFVAVPLEEKQGVKFGKLKEDALKGCTQFVLSVRAEGIPEEQVAQKLGGLSKIAAWDQIQSVLRSATPGAPLRVTHRPPPQVPVRPGTVYFLIDVENDYWKHVRREEKVAIYLPPPFDPTRAQIELMGIPDRD